MHLDTRLSLADDYALAARFTPTGPADTELEWFFTMAESDMGSRSNFSESLGEPPADSPESRAEAARAHRTILGWLQHIGDRDAGVLYAAYRARPWSLPLRNALGRVTGVVVRLGSAEQGLPDDSTERDALDLRTGAQLTEALARGDREALGRLEPRARVLLRGAAVAYEKARGGTARRLLPGVTP